MPGGRPHPPGPLLTCQFSRPCRRRVGRGRGDEGESNRVGGAGGRGRGVGGRGRGRGSRAGVGRRPPFSETRARHPTPCEPTPACPQILLPLLARVFPPPRRPSNAPSTQAGERAPRALPRPGSARSTARGRGPGRGRRAGARSGAEERPGRGGGAARHENEGGGPSECEPRSPVLGLFQDDHPPAPRLPQAVGPRRGRARRSHGPPGT